MNELFPPDPWWREAARMMLEESVNLETAAASLGIPDITPQVAQNIKRRKAWRDLLSKESMLFFTGKAQPSAHSKSILIGKMLMDAELLRGQGRIKDAADVLFQVAKMEGWVGPETTTNIFQTLSGDNLAKLKEQFSKKITTPTGTPSVN